MLRELIARHGRIAVACHNAGATEIVLAWLDDDLLGAVAPVLAGPARAIWERRFPHAPVAANLHSALETCGAVVTGSGWASSLEHQARREALALGRPVVAVVDHWVNYRERFVRGDELVLPDEVWVTDDDALAVARRDLPDVPARLVPNLYVARQLSRVKPLETVERDRLLYVAEPIRVDWGFQRPGELAALDFFARVMPRLALPPATRILLRPHPAESPDKYRGWIAGHPSLDVVVDAGRELCEALSEVRWVAGCETSVLPLALAAGRTAFCTLPPGAPPCRLPQAGLVHLRDLAPGGDHA
jgi:hypothetical protein